MFQRFRVAVRKWLALREFPRGKPKSSYVFFDYFVPYGGLHDRVIVYEHSGSTFLHFRSTGPLSAKDDVFFTTKVTPESLNEFFAWIEQRLPNADNVFLTKSCRDPAQLTMFAFDSERTRTYSVCVYDTHSWEEFRNIRGEIIERIKRMSGDRGTVHITTEN